MENKGTELPNSWISKDRVDKVLARAYPEDGYTGTEVFKQSIEEEMWKNQPSLHRRLIELATLTSDPGAFQFGSQLAFACIPEEQRYSELTLNELGVIDEVISKIIPTENRIIVDFKKLEEELEKNSPNFISLIKRMQHLPKLRNKYNPKQSDAFFYGVMFTIFPFSMRRKLDRLFEVETPKGTDRRRPDK